MCSKVGAAQVAAASTCAGVSCDAATADTVLFYLTFDALPIVAIPYRVNDSVYSVLYTWVHDHEMPQPEKGDTSHTLHMRTSNLCSGVS